MGEPSSCVPTELVLLPSAAGHLGNQLMGKRSLSFCLANKMRVKSVSASSLHSEEPGGGGEEGLTLKRLLHSKKNF